MSGTPLFDGATEHACPVCSLIHSSAEKALSCRDEHVKQERRESARKFARTGVSQFKKGASK